MKRREIETQLQAAMLRGDDAAVEELLSALLAEGGTLYEELPASKVFEIADKADTAEEALTLLATAFPEAETGYIAGLFRQRAAEQSKMAERYELERH